MIDKIRTKKQYEQVMILIENYLAKATESGGFKCLDKEENEELKKLSLLAEQYEDDILKIMPLPVTLENVVSVKMRELNITQAELAGMLGMGTSKLSQILNSKRKPDIPFLKAIHEKLGVDGNFILEKV